MLGNTLEDLKRKDISCLTTCRSKGGGVSIDLDAQNVIEAIENTGITLSSTQISACNKLINDLKAFELWVKSKSLYGMMGGTAAAHKFNWKDPRDLDVAFRIVWNGGITHSTNGVLGNGINGFGDTKISPSSVLSLTSTHLSYYSRTNLNINEVEIGARNGSAILFVQLRQISNVSDCYMNDSSFISLSSTASLGFYIGNRPSSGTKNFWKNGVKTHTQNTTATTSPSSSIYLLANNFAGTMSEPSKKECAFATIGDGLTDTEAANLYTAVQAFQTTLGRQV